MFPQILSLMKKKKKKKKKKDVLAYFSVQDLYQSHVQNIHVKIIPCYRFLSIPIDYDRFC